jgi:hypothetical protein
MKCRVLAAGWPFAGLLALDAVHAGDSSAAPVRGLIVDTDTRSGFLVFESEDETFSLIIDVATRCYGVDGYPIARGDIRVGDMVETVRERDGEDWVTTKIRVLHLVSSSSPDEC